MQRLSITIQDGSGNLLQPHNTGLFHRAGIPFIPGDSGTKYCSADTQLCYWKTGGRAAILVFFTRFCWCEYASTHAGFPARDVSCSALANSCGVWLENGGVVVCTTLWARLLGIISGTEWKEGRKGCTSGELVAGGWGT